MHNNLAQPIVEQDDGIHIENDWFEWPLPASVVLEEMSYPDTSYSFTGCFSKRTDGFILGYASGNYGHSFFSTGLQGRIHTGKYVVLQCTRLIANDFIIIKDHCMFSWGSVITDSWMNPSTFPPEIRKRMMEKAASSVNRHLEFVDPHPVVIEENVWVGFDAVIMPGVTIGRGAVIGCKSVITEDIPPYAVVVGNPAKVIKFLNATDTEEVKANAIREFA